MNSLLGYTIGVILILSAYWAKTLLPAMLLIAAGFILIIVSSLSSVVDFSPKKQKENNEKDKGLKS